MPVPENASPSDLPQRQETRLLLLGASNVTLAWPRIIAAAQSRFQHKLTVVTAHGMGRSYLAARSGFAFRQLPGILHSGLWERLDTIDPSDGCNVGLITDIGNDLVYGSEPQQVAESVEECIHRIRSWHTATNLVITRPPVESVRQLGRLRFALFRTVLFPRCGLNLQDIQRRTDELDERVADLAQRLNVTVVVPDRHWYGFDPIHIRFRHQAEAFGRIMEGWELPQISAAAASFDGVSRPAPATVWRLGSETQTSQPCVVTNRTRVFAY